MAREHQMTGEEIVKHPELFEAKMKKMRDRITEGRHPKTGQDTRRQRILDQESERSALWEAYSKVANQADVNAVAEKNGTSVLKDPRVIALAHGEDPETGEVVNWQLRAEYMAREARIAEGYPPEVKIIKNREQKKQAAQQRTEPEPTTSQSSTSETMTASVSSEQPVSAPVAEAEKAAQNPWVEKDRAAEMKALRDAYAQLHPEDSKPTIADLYADPNVVETAHGVDPKTGQVVDWEKRAEYLARMGRIRNNYTEVPSTESAPPVSRPVDHSSSRIETSETTTNSSWQDQVRQTYTAMNERVVAGVTSAIEWTRRFRRDRVRQAVDETAADVSRRVDPVLERVADVINQEAAPLVSAAEAFIEMRRNDFRRAGIALDVFRGRAANIDEIAQLQEKNEALGMKMDESLEASNIIKRGQAVWDSLTRRIRRSS